MYQASFTGHRDLLEGESGADFKARFDKAIDKLERVLRDADIGFQGGAIIGQVAPAGEPVTDLAREIERRD